MCLFWYIIDVAKYADKRQRVKEFVNDGNIGNAVCLNLNMPIH